MSYKFIPYTSLLNSIYIPFHESPKKYIATLENFLFETSLEGERSIINLNTPNVKYMPYIDISKYDFASKDWKHFNSDGIPFVLEYEENQEYFNVVPLYGVPVISAHTESLYPLYKFERDSSVELGVYTDIGSIIRLYKAVPIILTIEENPLVDITDYSNINLKPTLASNRNVNREFYYDFDQNRIITNQNLESYSPGDITLGFYMLSSKVSVKCRLSSNELSLSNVSPIVDYYIVKLSGQNLRE